MIGPLTARHQRSADRTDENGHTTTSLYLTESNAKNGCYMGAPEVAARRRSWPRGTVSSAVSGAMSTSLRFRLGLLLLPKATTGFLDDAQGTALHALPCKRTQGQMIPTSPIITDETNFICVLKVADIAMMMHLLANVKW